MHYRVQKMFQHLSDPNRAARAVYIVVADLLVVASYPRKVPYWGKYVSMMG